MDFRKNIYIPYAFNRGNGLLEGGVYEYNTKNIKLSTFFHRKNFILHNTENIIKNIEPKVNLDDAYELLGVEPNDDMQTIKKAYRKLIKEYHPDIIKSQGRDDEYIKEATQKTQEINQAYEMIKKAKKG